MSANTQGNTHDELRLASDWNARSARVTEKRNNTETSSPGDPSSVLAARNALPNESIRGDRPRV